MHLNSVQRLIEAVMTKSYSYCESERRDRGPWCTPMNACKAALLRVQSVAHMLLSKWLLLADSVRVRRGVGPELRREDLSTYRNG
jgi:hypothetical protein